MEKPFPEDLDWVTVRSRMASSKKTDLPIAEHRQRCSAQKMFEALHLRVKADVETRNHARTTSELQGGAGFVLESGADSFAAIAKDRTRLVRFVLRGDTIDVTSEPVTVTFGATVTFTGAGDCRFVVNGAELVTWQIARMALEALFFGL
jgi:hypothetical protein